MKKTLRKRVSLITVLLCLCLVMPAFALTPADAVDPIDTARKCSLTLTYNDKEDSSKFFKGLEIQLYQVGTVSADFKYSKTPNFSAYSFDMNAMENQTQWNNLTTTLVSRILGDSIPCDQQITTDANGRVKFTDMQPGMYLVRWTGNSTGENVSGFAPFMMEVPKLGADGKWTYDLTALPKPGTYFKPTPTDPDPPVEPSEDPDPPAPPVKPDDPVVPPTPGHTGTLRVTKIWDDEHYEHFENHRPESVDVAIYHNSSLWSICTLSSVSNWSYKWEGSLDDDWMVVELNVPDDYESEVEASADGFVIINSLPMDFYDPNDFNIPRTGDSVNIKAYIITMLASGTALLLLGIFAKSRRQEE